MIEAAAILLLLHGPDGHEIMLNPRQVTSLHAAMPGQKNKQFTDGVHCLVNTADGKFISVIETCEEINRAITQPRATK
jgi:hypothetical protein